MGQSVHFCPPQMPTFPGASWVPAWEVQEGQAEVGREATGGGGRRASCSCLATWLDSCSPNQGAMYGRAAWLSTASESYMMPKCLVESVSSSEQLFQGMEGWHWGRGISKLMVYSDFSVQTSIDPKTPTLMVQLGSSVPGVSSLHPAGQAWPAACCVQGAKNCLYK